MAAPKKVDYERIEPGWRAGILSPAELAAEYTAATGQTVSHTAIIKHFKKLGVPRDLGEKIRAKADRMVSQAMVSGKVSAETIVSDAKIIDGNAEQTAGVAIRHRADLKDLRDTAMAMLAELRQVGDHADTLDEMARILASESDDEDATARRMDKLREALSRATGLPGRIASIKALSETIAKIIDAERVAWKLDKPLDLLPGAGRTLTDAERVSRLATILERARNRPPPTDAPQANATVH